MTLREKMNLDYDGLHAHGAINIVAFGDSVTHGMLCTGDIDYNMVYWNQLRLMMLEISDYVPINVINAAIGGTTAKQSVPRMEDQVFSHHPDLLIVCFGLNDVNNPIEEYEESLRTIFDRCNETNTFTVFMTPNMLNTHLSDDTEPELMEYAEKMCRMQNEGVMDTFMDKAREVAKEKGILVCDCYAEWKKLAETKDVNDLLINRINHPTPEMHRFFAEKLFALLFPEETAK